MYSPKNTKNNKLIKFRQKLCKLNDKSDYSDNRSKLQKLQSDNSVSLAQIGATLQTIDEFYFRYEEKVSQLSLMMIQLIQFQRESILKQLSQHRKFEFQQIKQFQEYINSLQTDIQRKKQQICCFPPSEMLHQEISRLKPFDFKHVLVKVESMSIYRDKITKIIEQYTSLQINVSDIAKRIVKSINVTKIENQNAQINSLPVKKQQIDKQRQGSMFVQYEEEVQRKINEERLQNIFMHRRSEQKQQNLMDEDSRVKNSPYEHYKEHKYYKQHQYLKSFECEDQEHQLEQDIHFHQKKEKQFKHNRTLPQSITDQQIKKKLYHFIGQMKQTKFEDKSPEVSSRDQKQTKIRQLKRVKSEENFLFSRANAIDLNKDKGRMVPVEDQYESVKLGKSCAGGNKTGRQGDWALILKEQQTKYNDIRKKLKN